MVVGMFIRCRPAGRSHNERGQIAQFGEIAGHAWICAARQTDYTFGVQSKAETVEQYLAGLPAIGTLCDYFGLNLNARAGRSVRGLVCFGGFDPARFPRRAWNEEASSSGNVDRGREGNTRSMRRDRIGKRAGFNSDGPI